MTTIERAIVRNKSAWGPIDEDDDRPDNRAAELAASRNLADAVSAAFEDESREDRNLWRKTEAEAGKHGRVPSVTDLLAEVRVRDWKVLFEGSTLLGQKPEEGFPSVASWVLDEIRMNRLDFVLVPFGFETADDVKAVKTASEYEEERFLNISAE